MKHLCAFLLFTLFLSFTLFSQQNGIVMEYDGSGKLLSEQTYSNGILHGQARIYYENTSYLHMAGNNHNGNKEGLWTYFKNTATREVYARYHFSFGLKHGAFYEIKADTMFSGTYENEKLNGSYKISTFLIAVGIDTLFAPVAEGQYTAGVKTGQWKYYVNGRLHLDGQYRDGKKDMLWKEYDALSAVSNPTVMREMQYSKGQLEGKWIQHYTYQKGSIKNIKINAFYHLGKLNGAYSESDDLGILASGEYADGKKMGAWKERIPEMNAMREITYFEDKPAGKVVYKNMAGTILREENYKNGMQEGIWKYYDANGKVTLEETYQQGKLNGEATTYNSSGIIQNKSMFKNNLRISYQIYTANGSSVIAEYELLQGEKAVSPYQIEASETIGDTSYKAVYKYTGVLPADILTQFSKYKNEMPLHGEYEKMYGDKPVESGYYANNLKDGVWRYYYHPTIIWEVVYVSGKETKETFTDASTKQPTKGDYVVTWPNGKNRFEFKIKNGLRNGKSKWSDTNGNTLKELKYSDGISN